MNLQTDDNGFRYFLTVEAVKPEYKVVPVWNVLQFFTLEGRKTVMKRENIISIKDLQYMILDSNGEKYYLRDFRKRSLDEMYFYRKSLTFSGEDESILELHHFISTNRVFLLLSETNVTETTAMLERLYESHFKGKGKVPYKKWLELLDQSIKLEDYKNYGSSLVGFKTVCHQFEMRIKAIWDEIYKQNNQ